MKRVLVTGACGNIGAYVVALLLERGYVVRAIDLDTPMGRKAASRWSNRVDVRFGSICDDTLVRGAVTGVDHVIHLAAMVPPTTDVDQAASYAVNVVATRSLIEACEAQIRTRRRELPRCRRQLVTIVVAVLQGRCHHLRRPLRQPEALIHRQVCPGIGLARRPADPDLLDPRAGAKAEVKRRWRLRQEPRAQLHLAQLLHPVAAQRRLGQASSPIDCSR